MDSTSYIQKASAKDILPAFIYFLLSTIITWWFIDASKIYSSLKQEILSCSIAGIKWGIQIVAAFLLLGNKKWEFIRRIGYTCFIGSLILLPFCIGNLAGYHHPGFFIASLVISVLMMIYLYYTSVRNSNISIKWLAGWLICLAIAIFLQITVVFHLVHF